MTAPRLSVYQAFIIAAGELFSVLTAAAASPPPPERFMAAVSDAVATIDRAHSSLLLVASQDVLTAAAVVVRRAHRIREFLDPYQRSPHGLGELTQEYASACNAFTRTARDEVGNERLLAARLAGDTRLSFGGALCRWAAGGGISGVVGSGSDSIVGVPDDSRAVRAGQPDGQASAAGLPGVQGGDVVRRLLPAEGPPGRGGA
jgi:hypothetical protein